MPEGFAAIITQLESQRRAIETAISALREVEGSPSESRGATTAKRAGRPATRKGGLTEEGRRRISEALKRRWAAKRAGSATRKASAKRPGPGPEARKRMAEAMRKRWAAKRTGAQAKKRGPKKKAA
jgi:hypothetical protein